MALVVGINSYASLAYADAYLATSVRAADNWAVLGSTEKENALITAFRMIERAVFQGDRTPVERVTAATISAGGTGYAAGDILTLASGTGRAATFEVLTVAVGVIATIQLLDAGDYTVAPTSPDTPTTSGAGTGATLALTIATQTTRWPRTGVVDAEGDTVASDTVPDQILQAQCELAYELTQDVALETARDANSNIASVGAGGGVQVSFFRPQDANGRFPPTVQELLDEFLGSAQANANAEAGALGSNCHSNFDRCKFGLTEGPP